MRDLPPAVTPRYLSFPQAGQYLGVSRITIHRMVKIGTLPVVELPASGDKRPVRRIDREALDKALAQSA
ncbi:MAG: helix-turn-helix domain-containing protein [Gammaproteobacteria bacterium]|nr:helix-turn-helix domain-containing protein [Gammaproteobacteria bacterium]MYI05739.1 helix-turn-helix domain-containing protein [Gemmatimonadota bacterium]